MHIYFSGIGGAGISSLALIAKQAGFEVSGSDKQDHHKLQYLREKGITDIHIGQSKEEIAAVHRARPIDWLVYTSAVPMEQPDAPELRFSHDNGIKTTKRDEFLRFLLEQQSLQMIAVAGTHGKTTTTAMTIWLYKQLALPVSYSVAGGISFGEAGQLVPDSQYFIYEADEFDRNFLAFHPALSIITGIDWDHPDIYPTRDAYYQAFRDFISQSKNTFLWSDDAGRLKLAASGTQQILDNANPQIDAELHLAGRVNRLDAWIVAHAVASLINKPIKELLVHLNSFPGVERRFEQLIPHLVTDYAHTPPKIRGAVQLAQELAGNNVVIVYEGLHNTRQHFIKDELKHLFDDAKQLYIVPTYLAREDPNLKIMTPKDLKTLLSDETRAHTETKKLDNDLKETIQRHIRAGDLVVCITAGSGGSLDEWLRQQFLPHSS